MIYSPEITQVGCEEAGDEAFIVMEHVSTTRGGVILPVGGVGGQVSGRRS